MGDRHTSLSDYLIAAQTGAAALDPDLATVIKTVEGACRDIATAVGRTGIDRHETVEITVNVQGEAQKPLDIVTNTIILETCERSGQLCGMVSEELEEPYRLPASCARGAYLLAFDPLDGSSNVEANTTIGTIFSILRAPHPGRDATAEDFLQPGHRQVSAGYALYGPTTMLVLTIGHGVDGFTLDRDSGIFLLTHPSMRVPETTSEFAVNASNARFWEPPVSRYVAECVEGVAGPRGQDFNMRWIASMVVEVHRLLVRGGLYMYPRDTKKPLKAGRLRLLYEANPTAMLIEQAGGAASTGRERLLDIEPHDIHQRVPVILGSRREVERLIDYHDAFERGEPATFEAPLFNHRSLFRSS